MLELRECTEVFIVTYLLESDDGKITTLLEYEAKTKPDLPTNGERRIYSFVELYDKVSKNPIVSFVALKVSEIAHHEYCQFDTDKVSIKQYYTVTFKKDAKQETKVGQYTTQCDFDRLNDHF